jgi:uncharacterized protein
MNRYNGLRAVCFYLAILLSTPALADFYQEMRSLAEQGHAEAQYNLGAMYTNGIGVPQNSQEAATWYRQAAEQGHADAQFILGVMYTHGIGVPQNGQEAVKWSRKAAEQGHADAQYELGVSYYKGEGVPQDYVKAYFWWNIAAVTDTDARKNRDLVKEKMTPEQISEAQRLSTEYFEAEKSR